MASLPQRLRSQFLFLTRQTASTAWCSCTSTLASMPQTRFLLLNNGPTAVIRSRLFHGVIRRVKLSKNLPPAPRRHASSTAAKKPAAPTISTIKPTASVLRSYVERLATKQSRTLLYEAPSHFWYRVSSFAAGAFCITYTVVQYWEVYLHPREGLASWVPHAFGVICIFMTAMGLYFILGTQHIVRSIEVVPRALLSKKQLLSLPKTASETPILIQVSMQRPAPFLPMKKKLYTPEEIQLPFRMHGVLGNLLPGQIPSTPKQVTMVESVRAERAAREARAKEIQFRRDHILTSPFRDGAKVGKQVAGGVWSSIKRPFFREGFAKILLGKAEYKLDISGGWALDDGRAMDRLFTIRPAPGVAQ